MSRQSRRSPKLAPVFNWVSADQSRRTHGSPARRIGHRHQYRMRNSSTRPSSTDYVGISLAARTVFRPRRYRRLLFLDEKGSPPDQFGFPSADVLVARMNSTAGLDFLAGRKYGDWDASINIRAGANRFDDSLEILDVDRVLLHPGYRPAVFADHPVELPGNRWPGQRRSNQDRPTGIRRPGCAPH